MTTYSLATLSGEAIQIDASSVQELASELDGDLVARDDPGYEEARALWNAMIATRPALIARCAGRADVERSLAFARQHGILFSVRGAGHNIAGSGLCEGGLTIDLSGMRAVSVDVAGGTAIVEPGATLGDIDGATLAHGLALPVGINSTTGIAGLTLGGGFGWLSRKLGLTIDSLLSAELILADGTVVTASESENADLFWGLRGGGGNFGIVTSFEFRLHAVGPDLLSGLIVHPGSDARSVLEFYRSFSAEAPDELTVWAVLRDAPPLPFLPAEVHGTKVVVLAFVYAGEPAAGERALAPLLDFGRPHGTAMGVQAFAAFQQAFDPLLTPGARNYWKSHNFPDIGDGAIDRIVGYAETLPTPQSEIFLAQMGGATARVPADATAYPHRDAAFVMNVHTRWDDATQDDRCVAWAREFFDATAPYATGGVYLNFVSEAEDVQRVAAAYGGHYERLRQVKAKYDPRNLFRANLNVRP